MRSLKTIALDLLEQYEEAQRSVICEFSCSIEEDLKKLKEKCEKYRKEINEG